MGAKYWFFTARHVHAVHAQTVHARTMHGYVMHGHAMQATSCKPRHAQPRHARQCSALMLYARINSDMPTFAVALNLKQFNWHAAIKPVFAL